MELSVVFCGCDRYKYIDYTQGNFLFQYQIVVMAFRFNPGSLDNNNLNSVYRNLYQMISN